MALSHSIMTALLDERMSGYALTKSFDTSLGFFWKASHQQIYKCLRDLESDGLIEGERVVQAGRPDKTVYSLTAAGREALSLWVMGESRYTAVKDDLMVKLYNLDTGNLDHIAGEVQSRITSIESQLALYERIRSRGYAHPERLSLRRKGIHQVLKAGIASAEQTLSWLLGVRDMLLIEVKQPAEGQNRRKA